MHARQVPSSQLSRVRLEHLLLYTARVERNESGCHKASNIKMPLVMAT